MNELRQQLQRRDLTLGSWVQIGHPSSPEILANAGYDWLGIDCEHTDIELAVLTNMLRGTSARGVPTLIRVRDSDTLFIRQVLDLGAAGVIVPLVGDAAQARSVVAAAKYPPEGVRGYCFSRMNDYGNNFKAYAESANDETIVIAMIESRDGVENIDDILAVPGLDGVFLGPYDLSGAYGVPGEVDHPSVRRARETVLSACQRHQKAAGLHIVHPTERIVGDAVQDGFTFVALGADIVFLANVARQTLETTRRVCERSAQPAPPDSPQLRVAGS